MRIGRGGFSVLTEAQLFAAARQYAAFWERLGPSTLESVLDHMAPEVLFRDPFTEVRGRIEVQAHFERVYDRLGEVRVTVDDIGASRRAAFLKWRFGFNAGRKRRELIGVSEVKFNQDKLATEHIDHWDATQQVYATLPILGPVVRLIARRVGG